VRIGELMAKVPKASGGDRRSEDFKNDTAVHFETKTAVIEQAGFTPKQVQRFEALAAHPEIVEQAKIRLVPIGRIWYNNCAVLW
jgi:hypothetical protein